MEIIESYNRRVRQKNELLNISLGEDCSRIIHAIQDWTQNLRSVPDPLNTFFGIIDFSYLGKKTTLEQCVKIYITTVENTQNVSKFIDVTLEIYVLFKSFDVPSTGTNSPRRRQFSEDQETFLRLSCVIIGANLTDQYSIRTKLLPDIRSILETLIYFVRERPSRVFL